MQPGDHTLNSDLIAEDADYFIIKSSGATVLCGTLKPKLSFTSLQNLEIIGVKFTRCGDIMFSKLTVVSILNASFIGCGYGNMDSIRDMQMNYMSIVSKNKLTLKSIDRLSFKNCIIREMIKLFYIPNLNITRTRVYNIHAGTLRIRSVARIFINESTFVNTGAVYGGAIYSVGNNVSVTVINSNFSHCSAYGSGGAIYVSQGSLVVVNSSFDSNRAGGDRGSGGAVYVEGGSVAIVQCTFINNFAHIDGGAIFCTKCHSLSINASNFTSNGAVRNGGGIYAGSKLITISQSVFKNNTAQKGGAIQLLNGRLSLTVSYFINNTANVQGGAIYMSGDSIQVNESSFINNTALRMSGGAFYCGGDYANIMSFKSTFLNNSASYCGVMEVNDLYHKIDMINCTFTDNTATGQTIGGGVACIRNASVYISNCTFRRNTAKLDAGCLHVEESIMTVDSSSFVDNTASANGGVMHTNMYPTTYVITHSYFAHNKAGNSGGVMYIGRKGSDVRIQNETVFDYNHAAKKGGAITIMGSTLIISDTGYYSNSADLGRIISACNCDVRLPSRDGIVISKDPKALFCSYYDENTSTGQILPSHPQSLHRTTTSLYIHTHPTTKTIVSSTSHRDLATNGYQSNVHQSTTGCTPSSQPQLLYSMTTSYHIA